MTYYRYNALDIAAYLKWTSVPAEAERTYLDLIFQMREHIIARPLTKDFETFAQAVFRELYHVWARGFENEFSDVRLIAPEGSVALFCDQEFLSLESYLKLLSLHLIMTENLPYVRINFVGLPLLIGTEGEFLDFEKNVALAAYVLRLEAKDDRGNVLDLTQGIPSEPLCLSLQSEFRKELFGSSGYRIKRSNDYQEKMRILREKSKQEQDVRDILKAGSENRRGRRSYLPGVEIVLGQPPMLQIDTAENLIDKSEKTQMDRNLPDQTHNDLIVEPDIPVKLLHNTGEAISVPTETAASGEDTASSRTVRKRIEKKR